MNKKIYIIILVLVLALGAYALAFRNNAPQPQVLDEEPVACTMDALICPDGSGVGRSGPACTFSACPNAASYTGLLVQTESGFVLAMQVSGETGTVEYLLPLNFSTSNTNLEGLVGEEVNIKGSFVAGNTLDVDTVEGVRMPAGITAGVGVGATKVINGVSVTVNKIVEESRCPIDAICIQAGKLVANVTLKAGSTTQTLNMEAYAEARSVGAYAVSLVEASPSPMASNPAPHSSYVLTFKVNKK